MAEFMEHTRIELDRLALECPNVPERIWRQARAAKPSDLDPLPDEIEIGPTL